MRWDACQAVHTTAGSYEGATQIYLDIEDKQLEATHEKYVI